MLSVQQMSDRPDVVAYSLTGRPLNFKYAPARSWCVFALYLYFVNQVIVLIGALLALLGSEKINPRFFFGIAVIGLPGIILQVFLATLLGKRQPNPYYPRVSWELAMFVVAAAWSWVWASVAGLVHVFLHGSRSSLHPFETSGDAGTTFWVANYSATISAFIMIWRTVAVLQAYALNIFDPKTLRIRNRS